MVAKLLRVVWNYTKELSNVLWLSVRDSMHDKIFRMSAALAFYTIFSIAPILILIINIADSVFGRAAVEGEVYGQISEFVGHDAALQIQEIIANSMTSDKYSITTIISIIVLVFTATGVFTEIQDSINVIWRLKPKPKKGWLKIIINRLISFSMLLSLGIVLVITLMISTLLNTIGSKLTLYYPVVSIYYAYIINLIITFCTTMFFFGAIFKVLPDAHIKWKHVIIGAIFTTILFLLGKYGIGIYLGRSKVNTTFGAAGSTMIILLWIYYSAIILYIGAEFTKHYAQWRGSGIYPNDYAVWVENIEIERKDRLAPLTEPGK
ncbi:MAG: YihY/virulence factor BrkB family protein [Bacteroidota bacterium]